MIKKGKKEYLLSQIGYIVSDMHSINSVNEYSSMNNLFYNYEKLRTNLLQTVDLLNQLVMEIYSEEELDDKHDRIILGEDYDAGK